MNPIIIHVDMDAFYASVEMRDNPELRGKPLIIGSLPNERGVVSTCSYEARKYGVHSAMNIKEAYRLCPNGIYMHPHFDKYKAVSAQLHRIWDDYCTADEPVALDEAYLDVTYSAGNFDEARKMALAIKERTRNELGLSCSVGVAYSKTAAKTASEEKKPDGYFEIPTANDFVNLIIDRDVRVLFTVGAATAGKLYSAGIRTVRDIQNRQETVRQLLGKRGQWIVDLAYGIDNRKVIPYKPQDAKSVSREVTFQADVNNIELLKDILVLMSVCVYHRAQRYGLNGGGVTLKLTYHDMKSITRSRSILGKSTPASIYREAITMLDNVEKRPVRLIGVGIYNLSPTGDTHSLEYLFTDEENDKSMMLELLKNLQTRYGLDFIGHLEQIQQGEILHKTIEYMRKHFI